MSRRLFTLSLALVALGGVAFAAVTFIPWQRDQSVREEPKTLQAQTAASQQEEKPKQELRKQGGLEGVHAVAAKVFAETPGFGLERMPRMFRKIDYVFWSPGELDEVSPYQNRPELLKVFQGYVDYFTKTQSIAANKNELRFPVGLQGHFSMIERDIKDDGQGGKSQDLETIARKSKLWRIDAIDLVGLADPELPVTYETAKLSHRLPGAQPGQAKQEETIKTPDGKIYPKYSRPLDFFEIAGLEKLKEGDALYVRTKDNRMRMLGALRASADCAKCHSVPEGELLGAFSYTMTMMK
ncbi:MAG: hypothetical protein L0Y72_08635 [Gemmataceae bacterium]|nr:hypothetical protein [Gemmataceae bacterium]MCI0739097.1 hypothetical protein [Gemmataceae bacterium]